MFHLETTILSYIRSCGYLSFPPQPYLLFFLVTPALGDVGFALPIINLFKKLYKKLYKYKINILHLQALFYYSHISTC